MGDHAVGTHKRPLNEMDKACIFNYIIRGMSYTMAAKEAGYDFQSTWAYTKKAKAVVFSPQGRELAKGLQIEQKRENGMSREYVLDELKDIIANSDESVGGRVKALELYGKELGMFADTHILKDGEKHSQLADKAWLERQEKIALAKKEQAKQLGVEVMQNDS